MPFTPGMQAAKRRALQEYARWDSWAGRYAIGQHSVAQLIEQQTRTPRELVHGWDPQAAT